MPNQRASNIRRATITVGHDLYDWAKATAEKTGINDFSTFVRTLIAAEMAEEEALKKKLKKTPNKATNKSTKKSPKKPTNETNT